MSDVVLSLWSCQCGTDVVSDMTIMQQKNNNGARGKEQGEAASVLICACTTGGIDYKLL